MNAFKNMEALVLIAVALTVSATALIRTPAAPQAPTLAKDAHVIQVVISAKRMAPAEKSKLPG